MEKPGCAAGLQHDKLHQTWGIPGDENSLNLGEYWGKILYGLAFFLHFLGAHGLTSECGEVVFLVNLSLLLAQRFLLCDPSTSASSADLVIFHQLQQYLISHLLQTTSLEKRFSSEPTQVSNSGIPHQIQSFFAD